MEQKLHLLGIPFDGKSSFKGGARFAPHRIREEMKSTAYNIFSESRAPVLAKEVLHDHGDIDVKEYEEIPEKLEEIVTGDMRCLFLGGDHSITLHIAKRLHALHGSFHILQFDAHSDLYDEFDGDRFSHGCPFARIMESDIAESLTQVGVRTMNPHLDEQVDKFGVECYEMKHIAHFEPSWVDGPLYISVDLDVIDPAFAPGLSHREPGGISPRALIDWLQQINVPVIGCDLVEYNPIRDIDEGTAALCYKLAKELLDVLWRNPFPAKADEGSI